MEDVEVAKDDFWESKDIAAISSEDNLKGFFLEAFWLKIADSEAVLLLLAMLLPGLLPNDVKDTCDEMPSTTKRSSETPFTILGDGPPRKDAICGHRFKNIFFQISLSWATKYQFFETRGITAKVLTSSTKDKMATLIS
jgi:hypothetical protein